MKGRAPNGFFLLISTGGISKELLGTKTVPAKAGTDREQTRHIVMRSRATPTPS
jgi:hypothetical protein